MSLTASLFAASLLAKCAAPPYYAYESVTLKQTQVEGELPEALRERYAEITLWGDEHGFAAVGAHYLRVGERTADPETAEDLERLQRSNRGRGCHRIPIDWIAIWPGSFRAEPGENPDASFVPGTMEIDPKRESAVLTLELEDGPPVVVHYSFGAMAQASGCSVDGEAPARAPIAGLLLILGVGLVVRRRP